MKFFISNNEYDIPGEDDEVYDLKDLEDVIYDCYEGTSALEDYIEDDIDSQYPTVTIGNHTFYASEIVRDCGYWDEWVRSELSFCAENARYELERGRPYGMYDDTYLVPVDEDDDDEEDDE